MGLFSSGRGGFSGGGIGSSANTTTSTTDNKNNAITGDDAALYDTRGGNITFTDAGAFEFAAKTGKEVFGFAATASDDAFDFASQSGREALGLAERSSGRAFDFTTKSLTGVFDFATQVNDRAARNLQEGTFKILDKVTIDSGQRIQAVTETFGKYAVWAGVSVAALIFFKR